MPRLPESLAAREAVISGTPGETALGRPWPPPGAGPAAAALRWRRVFPGLEQELSGARSWLAGLLPDYPARDDVLTVGTELAANAIRHSASGRGGFFAMEISWLSRPATIRVAVADGGGPASPAALTALARLSRPVSGRGQFDTGPLGLARSDTGPLGLARSDTGPLGPRLSDPGPRQAGLLAESGRGLRLVRALALRAGQCGDERGRLVWADVRWAAEETPEPGYPDGYRAALEDVQALLLARYPDAAIWFGHATMHWWALAGDPRGGPSRLLTAESPLELARLLDLEQARQRLNRRPSRGRHGATGPQRVTGPRPALRPTARSGEPACLAPRDLARGPAQPVAQPWPAAMAS